MAGQVRPQRHTTLILLTLLLLCQSVNGQSAAKSTPQPSPVASPNPLVIPVPQIAAESIQLNQRLRSVPDRIVSDESLGETEHQVNKLSATTGVPIPQLHIRTTDQKPVEAAAAAINDGG